MNETDFIMQVLMMILPYLVVYYLGAISIFGLGWKLLPAWSKKLFLAKRNSNPLIANAYDDHHVALQNDKIFPEGIIYNKVGWHIIASPIVENQEMSTTANGGTNERLAAQQKVSTIFKKAYHISGLNRAFYFAYSRRAIIVNPEVLEAFELSKVLDPKTHTIKYDRENLISALQKVKNKFIEFQPFITTLLDPRAIQEAVPDLYPKTTLDAIEKTARDLERGEGKSSMGKLLLFGIIAVVAVMVIMFFLSNKG
jgi:hypothetical protein